jgi:HAD superfamily hydrolase (TIGR01509 family)
MGMADSTNSSGKTAVMTIKLVIFDLDGVLIDSRMIHFETLNKALADINDKYVITMEEHLSTYDGLSTTKKLELLAEKKMLPKEFFNDIWVRKQKYTVEAYDAIKYNWPMIEMFKRLMRESGVKLAVASNSITQTMDMALKQLGVYPFIEISVSNENVKRPKPYPEMYWQCMAHCNVLPSETMIIEDSHIGRKAALASGGNLLAVQNPDDVKVDTILKEIKRLNEEQEKPKNVPWIDKKLNVVIPMAGKGSRFANAGYTFPKPLIEVWGKPMIQLVVENLNIDANYTFIVQKEHYEKYNMGPFLKMLKPGCNIVQTDGVTEGAACTVLLTKEIINNDNPLLIVNSDQYLDWNSNEALYAFSADGIDGGILTFESISPKWSYAAIGDDGFVSDVREKEVISREATCGLYYWRHGRDFVKYSERMVARNLRVNNEFYVAPVYKQAIEDGQKVRCKKIEGMWSIGTPEDLNTFLSQKKEI